MAKHTMSMYPTKDAMIDAMQAEIDSLETENTDMFDRLNDEITDLRAQLEASEFHRSNNLIEISELCAKLAEARKDSERLDWVVGSCNDYGFDIGANNTMISRLYWIAGIDEIARGKTPREAIDNAMKGGE